VPDPVQSSTRLSAAVAPFLDDGTLAFIWADMDLTVLRVAGPVMTADAVGQPLTASLPVFIGYEDDLADLRAGKTSALDLPNIAMPGIDRVDGRMHVSVRWHAGEAAFVILIARALGRADLDLELQRQFRARRLAETELVAQAESVHATNKVLAEVNRDLAEFTHVVSHDLKAPMRAMRYFVDDLETSLAGDGPDGGDPHEHLARLRAQSRRMTAMLSSLLSYAKLDRKQDAVEAVDTGALVLAIIASLPRRDGVVLRSAANGQRSRPCLRCSISSCGTCSTTPCGMRLPAIRRSKCMRRWRTLVSRSTSSITGRAFPKTRAKPFLIRSPVWSRKRDAKRTDMTIAGWVLRLSGVRSTVSAAVSTLFRDLTKRPAHASNCVGPSMAVHDFRDMACGTGHGSPLGLLEDANGRDETDKRR
jgi:hypothetical protein